MGSRIHLVLEDSVAAAYNRVQEAWFMAQEDHKKRTGRQWNPMKEPLAIKFNPEDKEAYDAIGNIINLLVELNGGSLDIPEHELTSDFLVKVEG